MDTEETVHTNNILHKEYLNIILPFQTNHKSWDMQIMKLPSINLLFSTASSYLHVTSSHVKSSSAQVHSTNEVRDSLISRNLSWPQWVRGTVVASGLHHNMTPLTSVLHRRTNACIPEWKKSLQSVVASRLQPVTSVCCQSFASLVLLEGFKWMEITRREIGTLGSAFHNLPGVAPKSAWQYVAGSCAEYWCFGAATQNFLDAMTCSITQSVQ
jgi:hypothetical protein